MQKRTGSDMEILNIGMQKSVKGQSNKTSSEVIAKYLKKKYLEDKRLMPDLMTEKSKENLVDRIYTVCVCGSCYPMSYIKSCAANDDVNTLAQQPKLIV